MKIAFKRELRGPTKNTQQIAVCLRAVLSVKVGPVEDLGFRHFHVTIAYPTFTKLSFNNSESQEIKLVQMTTPKNISKLDTKRST